MRAFSFIIVLLLSCTYIYAQSKNSAAINYIELYKEMAIREMELTGIPASITLAQALHESASGTSMLAVKANNHFGVKCSSNWSGKKFYRNNNVNNNCFRKYESVEDAYKDRSRFLSLNKKYKFLFQYSPSAYKQWAYGLQRSGYATSKTYASQLLYLINLYDLHQYDKKEGTDEEINDKIHEVKKGESLYTIAKKYHTSVSEIKNNNNLKNNLIKPGQKLIIIE